MKTIVACILSLLAGIALGWVLPKKSLHSDGVQGDESKPERASAERTHPRPVDVGPSEAPSAQQMFVASGLQEEPEEDLVAVPKSLIKELSLAAGSRTVGQALFSKDGKVEATLQIVDREKAALQTTWRSSREKIRALEARSAQAEDLEDGSVRITLPDLTDDMQGVGKEFHTSVRGILGDNRGEIFLAMKQADQLFAPPAGERSYTVSPEATGDGGWRFRMTLEDANGQRVWVGEGIPEEIRHLTDAAQIIPSLEQPEGAPEDEVCGD